MTGDEIIEGVLARMDGLGLDEISEYAVRSIVMLTIEVIAGIAFPEIHLQVVPERRSETPGAADPGGCPGCEAFGGPCDLHK